jgi:hypothetical protein
MINDNGTPFIGYVSLSNGSPGPTALTLYQVVGQSAYSLQPTERLYITAISISTNDTTQQLITVDSAGPTPTYLARVYLANTQPPYFAAIPAGTMRGIFNTVPRAGAGAVTLGKTVEVIVAGYISRS